jgi:hypothetical protein
MQTWTSTQVVADSFVNVGVCYKHFGIPGRNGFSDWEDW